MQYVVDLHREFLTSGDVARELRCTQQWVRSLIKQGKLRAIRTPLGFLVSPDSVAQYQRDHVSTGRTGRVAY